MKWNVFLLSRPDGRFRMGEVVTGLFSKEKTYHTSPVGGGDGGGGGMSEELEKRVKHLEEGVANINNNVTILTTRSENFATKNEMVEMREGVRLETAKIREGLRDEMAETRERLRAEMAETREVLKIQMSELGAGLTLKMEGLRSGICIDLQKSMNSQIKWLISVVVGVMTLLIAVMAFIFNM